MFPVEKEKIRKENQTLFAGNKRAAALFRLARHI